MLVPLVVSVVMMIGIVRVVMMPMLVTMFMEMLVVVLLMVQALAWAGTARVFGKNQRFDGHRHRV